MKIFLNEKRLVRFATGIWTSVEFRGLNPPPPLFRGGRGEFGVRNKGGGSNQGTSLITFSVQKYFLNIFFFKKSKIDVFYFFIFF